MPFELTNAPATFQEMMDKIFKDLNGVMWYLDDILIYRGNSEAKHQQIVEWVLQKLLDYNLAINLEKSIFYEQEIEFQGHVINGAEIKIQKDKVNVVQEWPTPSKKKKVQAFLGFTNYYCHFIFNYSTKVKLLIELTKNVPFS